MRRVQLVIKTSLGLVELLIALIKRPSQCKSRKSSIRYGAVELKSCDNRTDSKLKMHRANDQCQLAKAAAQAGGSITESRQTIDGYDAHMPLRRALSLALLSASCITGLSSLNPAPAQQSVDCWLNEKKNNSARSSPRRRVVWRSASVASRFIALCPPVRRRPTRGSCATNAATHGS